MISRTTLSVLKLLGLIILFIALFYVAKLTIGPNSELVQFDLLNRAYKTANDPASNIELAADLLAAIDQLILKLLIITFAISFCWVVFANLKPISRPGVARKFVVVWLCGLALGILVCVTISAFFSFEVNDLIAVEKRPLVPIVGGSVFVVGYTVFGTFFTTPKMMRPAVPIISAIFR